MVALVACATARVAHQPDPLPTMNTSQETPTIDRETGLPLLTKSPAREDKVILTDEEWKKRLTPEQYRILRGHGTEPAFCGVNMDYKGEGVYQCAGCGLPLFDTKEKFDSGTGWPSYNKPIKADNLWYRLDTTFGMRRIEVNCGRCDGHLGHVFPDGPAPTNLRYCMNGNALNFVKSEK
jgi:methionine-R-sulfoxide reductase